jgi:hypothetical protein
MKGRKAGKACIITLGIYVCPTERKHSGGGSSSSKSRREFRTRNVKYYIE